MKRKIKLTEKQMTKLLAINEVDNVKKIKISESQYKRLFDKKVDLNEDASIAVSILEFANETIAFLKEILTDPSQAGLSTFWVKLGVSRGELFSSLADLGIITAVSASTYKGTKKVLKIRKRHLIKGLKILYNEMVEERYDKNTGKINEPEKEDKTESEIFLGGDMELSEDNYPLGASDDPNATYNETPDETSNVDGLFEYVDEVNDQKGYNILFVEDGDKKKYVVVYSQGSTMFEMCGGSVDMDCVIDELNYKQDSDNLEIGECGYDCGTHKIHVLDEEMKEYLIEYHGTIPEVRDELTRNFDMSEATTTGSVGGGYDVPLFGTNNQQKRDKVYEAVSKKTGRSVKEIKQIIESKTKK